jgi:UDP-N-acetylmuramate: L-alanyl-gamma-D-glutamyl-meso-diaminopimelate ligase
MGICGTGMASLAGLLKNQGYDISGSDQNIYPPMSELLKDLEIPVMKGYGPANLKPEPDLVIVGNVITALNPEAVELARIQCPYLSLPQALNRFAIRDRTSIVIAGTHGKTTTTSLTAWLLEASGLDPGFMIGGLPKNFARSFKQGKGSCFVVEGDEYDTAFFDKGPKFLHYNPKIVILTSIEFDHADIYRDLAHLRESFQKLIALIPRDGLLIANGDDPLVREEASKARCRVVTYGFGTHALWTARDIHYNRDMTELSVFRDNRPSVSLQTPLYGDHNLSNLLSVVVLADALEIPDTPLQHGMMTFEGIRRRQDLISDEGGIRILDDFAHHPTAVRETIRAVKGRYPDRRLLAVFEPRSNSSRRNIFQDRYAMAFGDADLVFIPEPPMMEKIPENERFSSARLVSDLQEQGKQAFFFPDTRALLDGLLKTAGKGDIILIMSNGAFDNLHHRLRDGLRHVSGKDEKENPKGPDISGGAA